MNQDILIDEVENGYIIYDRRADPGMIKKQYVAEDIDKLCEIIRLILGENR